MVFVPARASERGEVAGLLLAMAREADLPARAVQSVRGGYQVPDAMASLVETFTHPEPVEPETHAEPESKPEPVEHDVHAVREWARANGFAVSPKGRIKAEIMDAYATAHKTGE